MAMAKCDECGGLVSTKAEACPGCGAPVEDGEARETLHQRFACPECGNVYWELLLSDIREEGKWSRRIAIFALVLAGIGVIQVFVEGFENWPGILVWLVVAGIAWGVHESRGSHSLYECAKCGYRAKETLAEVAASPA